MTDHFRPVQQLEPNESLDGWVEGFEIVGMVRESGGATFVGN